MIISEEQLEQLSRIYNTMFDIQTKGENTLIMADCIRALEQVIINIKKSSTQQQNSKFKSISEEE